MTCRPVEEMVDERISRVLTQYRESPRLLYLLKTYLGAVAQTALQVCDLPEKFDLSVAVGDQLTLLGKRLGWPRNHCVCDTQPVFGFECEDQIQLRPIAGFGAIPETRQFGFDCAGEDAYAGFAQPYNVYWSNCDEPDVDTSSCSPGSTWVNCASGIAEISLDDDEIYRRFLMVRRYQYLGLFDLSSLEKSLEVLFGPQARVLYAGQRRVVIAPGRDLTDAEINLLQLYPRVLPVALGVEVRFHFGSVRVFGFGEGLGGLNEPVIIPGPNTGKVFGFECGDTNIPLGGFCLTWDSINADIAVDGVNTLGTEEGDDLVTGYIELTEGAHWVCNESAPWMCEIDVRPYSC